MRSYFDRLNDALTFDVFKIWQEFFLSNDYEREEELLVCAKLAYFRKLNFEYVAQTEPLKIMETIQQLSGNDEGVKEVKNAQEMVKLMEFNEEASEILGIK